MSSENPPEKKTAGWIIVGLIFFGLVYLFWSPDSEEDKAAEAAEQAKREKAGFHCLSGWDGSHRDVVKVVKGNLRDPDSFDHIETQITPVDSSGEHRLYMKYRANNALGGKVIGQAEAIVTNRTCNATVSRVE